LSAVFSPTPSRSSTSLAAAGIESIEDLRGADAESVASEVQGVSADRIREWQAKVDVEATAGS
jgi:DNA topoisomerase-1